jgi:hypothetical protein
MAPTSIRDSEVRALAEVLADPSVGGFDVHELINRPTAEVAQEIEGFFEEARLGDLRGGDSTQPRGVTAVLASAGPSG